MGKPKEFWIENAAAITAVSETEVWTEEPHLEDVVALHVIEHSAYVQAVGMLKAELQHIEAGGEPLAEMLRATLKRLGEI